MAESETPLPQFSRPPVEEVSLAAHFRPAPPLGIMEVAQLARAWEAGYPQMQEVPAIPPLPEDAVDETFGKLGVQVEMLERAPLPRVWFLSPDGTLIRQIQQDRFVQNWRRVKPGDDYPHYDKLLPEFRAAYEDLEAVLGLKPAPSVCEVTYTNPVRLTGAFTRVGEAQMVLAPWSGTFSDDFLPEPDQLTISARFRMIEPDGAHVGQLDVTAHPALHAPTGEQLMLLQLAARGRPMGGGLEGVLQFLDVAHKWIVRGFKSLTTAEMHGEWGME